MLPTVADSQTEEQTDKGWYGPHIWWFMSEPNIQNCPWGVSKTPDLFKKKSVWVAQLVKTFKAEFFFLFFFFFWLTEMKGVDLDTKHLQRHDVPHCPKTSRHVFTDTSQLLNLNRPAALLDYVFLKKCSNKPNTPLLTISIECCGVNSLAASNFSEEDLRCSAAEN